MKDQIEKILIDKKVKSGGHCGTYVPEILNNLGVEYKDVRTTLNQLFKENKIRIRPGSHGDLLFWKPKVIKQP